MKRQEAIQKIMDTAERYSNGELYGTGAMTDIGIILDEYTQKLVTDEDLACVRLSLPDAYSIREHARKLDPHSVDYKDGFEDGVYWLINRIKKGNKA